ncbi:type II secretion system protein [Candidatus Wolfebacteria bacterium]|nr:type II secretion system protein [Candidatus Wolfebacteria bacterium]
MAKKGFTLLELLIVIGILAILTAAVVVVLNPAQLLAQARDSQRLSDLSSVSSAINLYLTTATSTTIGTGPYSTANATCGFSSTTTCTVSTSTAVNSTGWVRVDLTQSSGGSPLPALPIDPTNSATYQYAYIGNDNVKTFELNARLESEKYRGRMSNDGGNQNTCATYNETTCWYEIGNDPDLNM